MPYEPPTGQVPLHYTHSVPCRSRTHPSRSRSRKGKPRVLVGILAFAVLFALSAILLHNFLTPAEAADADWVSEETPAVFSAPTEPVNDVADGDDALARLEAMAAEYPELAPLLQNPAEYPERLLKLAANKPEAIPFVLGWPNHAEVSAPADISPELAAGGVPALFQWDPRWGYSAYAGGVIGLDGCGPVCLSMAATALTGNAGLDPLTVAAYSESSGHSDPACGTSWSLMAEGAGSLGLQSRELPLDYASIADALEARGLVICSVRAGDFTTTGHFILLAGMDGAGNFIVHDPNSRDNTGKAWSYERLSPQVKNLWALSL